MNQMLFRHETKHFITYGEYMGIRQRLQSVSQLDVNVCDSGTYLIRSLYFDNYNDKILQEKISGVNERRKFRIRCYNHDASIIQLEKKSKKNGLCNKQSVRLSKSETEKIINGDINFLYDKSDALYIEFYTALISEQLKPKVIIDYEREPYIYAPGNVRITFDMNIKTSLSCCDYFNHELPNISAQFEDGILMEVKYDAYLPELIMMCIQVNERSATAFSKYAVSRRFY